MAAPVRLSALVVGSGWARHAAAAFSSRSDVEVIGVLGRGSPRTRDLAAVLGAPVFSSLDEALAAASIDVAIVAIDEHQTPVIARRLLEAGCDVLCAHPVASRGETVRELMQVAARRGRIVSTDYSLRSTAAFRAAERALASDGVLLRTSVIYPGRLLPMALDLALALAGPARAVFAARAYPESVAATRARAPAAFPPSLLIEHAGGAVSSLVPSPHARAEAAFTVVASAVGGRIEIELPGGGAERVRCLRGGAQAIDQLAPALPPTSASESFGAAMQRLAHEFVDAVLTRRLPPSSLHDEAHLRDVWRAVGRASREGRLVEVAETTS